jgi:hypothetical protein
MVAHRRRTDKIQVWMRDNNKREAIEHVGKQLRVLLGADAPTIEYYSHETVMSSGASYKSEPMLKM